MPVYNFDFNGKVVVITGASRGIGQAIAIGYGGFGAKVVLIGRDVARLEETAVKVTEAGGYPDIIKADMNSKDDLDTLLSHIKEKYGKVDILINNAGVGVRKAAHEITEEDWDWMIDTNLKSQFFFSVAIAKNFMLGHKNGSIVNIGSMGGFVGVPGGAPYAASKGGVINMTRSLAVEWAPYGIRVNSVCPGYVATDLITQARSNEDWMRLMKIRTPMGRIGEVEDVVGACLFMSSEMASYITGSFIYVDGGSYAQGY